nr:MAG TPA: hypothetical protein [Caudoviricetes sp.]
MGVKSGAVELALGQSQTVLLAGETKGMAQRPTPKW